MSKLRNNGREASEWVGEKFLLSKLHSNIKISPLILSGSSVKYMHESNRYDVMQKNEVD